MLAMLLSFIGIRPLAFNFEDVVCCVDSGMQCSAVCDPFLGMKPRTQFPQLLLMLPWEQFL